MNSFPSEDLYGGTFLGKTNLREYNSNGVLLFKEELSGGQFFQGKGFFHLPLTI